MPSRSLQSVFAVAAIPLFAAAEGAGDAWIARIRHDHPRLFFNEDMWPYVRDRARRQEKEWYATPKRRVDTYPDDPMPESLGTSPAYREKAGGGYELVELPRPREWGQEAMETAFVYLMTGQKRYLEKAKKMLQVSVAAYKECYKIRPKQKLVTVTFTTEEQPVGHIRIASGGKVLFEKDLAGAVTAQAGLIGWSL